jgi:hypothetical protein
MQMEKHVTVVAILHLVYSAMALIGGVIVFAVFSGIGGIITHIPEASSGDAFDAAAILWAIGTFIAGFLVIFAIPGIIGAIGLLKRKGWGRILALVVSFFDLLHIPFGTLLGGYSIWVLFHNDTIALFQEVSGGPPPVAPQPRNQP